MAARKTKNIKTQLFMAMLLFIMLPIVLMGAITNIITKNIIQSKVDYLVDENFRNMYLSVTASIDSLFDIANHYSEDKFVAENIYLGTDSKKIFHHILNNWSRDYILGRVNYPFYFILLDYKGNVYTNFTHSPNANYNLLYDKVESGDWFRQLKSSHSSSSVMFLGEDLLNGKNSDKIFIGQNIIYEFDNVGIILLQIDYKYISSLLDNRYFEGRINTYMVSGGDDVLVQSRKNSMPYSEIEKIASTAPGEAARINSNTDYISIVNTASFPNSGTQWSIGMLLEAGGIYKDIRIINMAIAAMLLICVVVFIVIERFYTTKIIKPIQQINAAMHKVKDGNLNAKVENMPNNEISQLGQGFNLMVNEINSLIENVYYEEMEKRNIEIKMLQSQIKPHFIRNTLNIIQWMAKMKKAYGISKAIQSFTSLIDYNFINTDITTSVKEELEFLEDYIYFEKLRYQNKFTHKVEADDDVLDLMILKLTLQPIVENCIVHGIAPKKSKSEIVIKAAKKEGCLVFTITDDGVGIGKEKLRKVLEEKHIPEDQSDKHIGLPNVNRRIKMNFGERFGITIKSTQGQGTMVSITLPLIENKREIS